MDTYYLVNVVYKFDTYLELLANNVVTSTALWPSSTLSNPLISTVHPASPLRMERPIKKSCLIAHIYICYLIFLMSFFDFCARY